MYFTREQFKDYQKICAKLRIPILSVHINKKKFLKLAKAEKEFRIAIKSKLKVCRKRVFICKYVKRVGKYNCPKFKRKKKNIELRRLCRKFCYELSKVCGVAKLRKKKSKNKKSKVKKFKKVRKSKQKACGEVIPHIDLTIDKGNSEGNTVREYAKANQQSAVVIISDDDDDEDGGTSSSKTSSKKDEPNLREKLQTQLELLRAKKNDHNAFVSPLILNDEQVEMNRKSYDDETIDLDTSNENDDIEIVTEINNGNDSSIQSQQQLIHRFDEDLVTIEDNPPINEKSEEVEMDIVPQTSNKESIANGNKGIIDVLFAKFNIKENHVYRSTPVIDQLDCSPTNNKNIEDPSMKLLLKNKVQDVLEDSSSSYSEFYGFDNENDEVIKNLRHNPDLLPTPYVSKVRIHAAFLTDDININEITIEEHKEDTNAKKRLIISSDKVGLVNEFSTPPKLTLPTRPRYMEKPRTVAQKRILLEGNEDIRYHMLENESKIFCHLNRRQKSLVDGQSTPLLQIELMSSIQKQNIPFTRDSWRALAWLKTQNSNYFYRTVKWKGSDCKIIGSKGNHPIKSICFDSKPMKSVQNIDSSYCNCNEFPENLKINTNTESTSVSQVPSTIESTEVVSKPKEKLRLGKNIHDYWSKIKPGPMSSKIGQYNKMTMDDEDCFLSTAHAYNMPQVKLKVCPKLNRPLNEGVKPFLKMILPYENITEEWAKFTVSTVMTKSQVPKENNTSKYNEFSFTIPYMNNQEKILVRERKIHESLIPNETTDNFNEKLTFANDVAQDDILGNEVAQILTEMTDSVAITLSENNFIRVDPDIDYNQKDDDLQKTEVKKAKDDNESKINQKVLKELKKLNAKFITANDNPKKRLSTRCREKFCENGCVCESLDSEVLRLHCGEIECVLGCQCKKKHDYVADQASAEFEQTSLSNDDLNRLCAKATASLAREERDFAPTVILTNNNTMLIHNRSSSQRRITKVPKKFSDYESEDIIQTPVMNSIPTVDSPKILETEKVKVKVILPKRNAEFDHLRHVKVNIQRLVDVSHIEPLCMVHCLYKCYCKNQSRSGKAFRFDEENDFKSLVKEDIADSNEHLLQQLPTSYRKRRYSFDRTYAEDSKFKKYRQIGDSKQIQTTSENNFTIVHEPIDNDNIEIRNDNEIIQASTIPGSCVSRRVCPVNRNFYRARNLHSRDRYIAESKQLIGSNAVKRKLLLEKRIQHCVEFYRSESLKHRVNYPKLLIKNADKIPIYINVCDTDEKIQSNPILRALVNSNKVLLCINRNRYVLQMEENFDSFIREIMEIISKISKSIPVCVIRRSQDTNDIKSTKDDRNKIGNNFNTMQVLHLLKNFAIQSNDDNNDDINDDSNYDSNDNIVTSIGSLLKSLKERNQKGSDSSNPTILNDKVYISNNDFRNIQTMNCRISSTMLKIHQMILKNSERISHPHKGVLFLLKWKYLLIAFEDHLFNIYEYEIGDSPVKKLIITQMECSAEQLNFLSECHHIRDLRNTLIDKIPTEGFMLSKMITGRIEGVSTKNLTLLLQGNPDYWIIDGFLNTEKHFIPKSKISKPTPISHPRLSKKIALYYSLMVKNNEIQESLVKQRARNSPTQLPENFDAINTKDSNVTASPTALSAVKTIDTSQRDLLNDEASEATVEGDSIYRNKLNPTVKKNQSNIAIIKQTSPDTNEIRLPAPEIGCANYFALIFVNDFSDLYIASWDTYVSYGKIMDAINLAQIENRSIEIKYEHISPDTPESDVVRMFTLAGVRDRIYIGPYKSRNKLDLILYQNIDGQMFLREEYLQRNNVKRTTSTVGTWIYVGMPPVENRELWAKRTAELRNNQIPPGTECIIIDSDEEDNSAAVVSSGNQQSNKSEINTQLLDPKLSMQSKLTDFMEQKSMQRSLKRQRVNKPKLSQKVAKIASISSQKDNDSNENDCLGESTLITNDDGKVLNFLKKSNVYFLNSADDETTKQGNQSLSTIDGMPLLHNSFKMMPNQFIRPMKHTRTSTITSADAIMKTDATENITSQVSKSVPNLNLLHTGETRTSLNQMPALVSLNPSTKNYIFSNTTDSKLEYPKAVAGPFSSATLGSAENKMPSLTQRRISSQMGKRRLRAIAPKKLPEEFNVQNDNLTLQIDSQDSKKRSPTAMSFYSYNSASQNMMSENDSLSGPDIGRLEMEHRSLNVDATLKIDSQNSIIKAPTAISFYDHNSATQNMMPTEMCSEEFNKPPDFARRNRVSDLWQSINNNSSNRKSPTAVNIISGASNKPLYFGRKYGDTRSSKKGSQKRSKICNLKAEFSSLNDNIDNKKEICDVELENLRKCSPLRDVIVINDDDDEENKGEISIPAIENHINYVDTPDGKYEKGFIISDIVEFGRMRAVKKENKIFIKTKLSSKFEIADLEKMFTKYVRSMILGTMPVDLNFNWRFEDNPAVYNVYPIHKRGLCTKKIVVGKNVFCDISKMNEIHLYPQYYRELLAYRLLATVSSAYQVQSCLYTETIDSTVALIEILNTQEKKLLNMKQDEITKQEALKETFETLTKQANKTNNEKESVGQQGRTNQETFVTTPDYPDITEILDSDDDF